MNAISKTKNKILMSQARDALSGRWGLAIGTMVVYLIILVAAEIIPGIGWLISILITGPMTVGLCIFSLSISRKQDPHFSQIFDGFQKFGVSLGAYILQTIFVLLWTLLLIIPGIIAALSYSMTFFIIAENDSIGPLEAIKKSKEMMDGNKWKLFCLNWRFFGWALLCIITLGIGFLWLIPYMNVTYAKFYDDIKTQASRLAPMSENTADQKTTPAQQQFQMANAQVIVWFLGVGGVVGGILALLGILPLSPWLTLIVGAMFCALAYRVRKQSRGALLGTLILLGCSVLWNIVVVIQTFAGGGVPHNIGAVAMGLGLFFYLLSVYMRTPSQNTKGSRTPN